MDHISQYLGFAPNSPQPPIQHNETPNNPPPAPQTPILTDDFLPETTTEESKQPHPTDDIRSALYRIKDEVNALIRLVEQSSPTPLTASPHKKIEESMRIVGGEQIIEGFFNGEKMVGPDGGEYAVPPNYASKSKLVEGDQMKLTITHAGKFIYKQIGPVERKRIVGVLNFDEDTQLWSVAHNGDIYKVLTASITFYKGKPGDHAVILIPREGKCSWGAMENIVAT